MSTALCIAHPAWFWPWESECVHCTLMAAMVQPLLLPSRFQIVCFITDDSTPQGESLSGEEWGQWPLSAPALLWGTEVRPGEADGPPRWCRALYQHPSPWTGFQPLFTLGGPFSLNSSGLALCLLRAWDGPSPFVPLKPDCTEVSEPFPCGYIPCRGLTPRNTNYSVSRSCCVDNVLTGT